MERIRLRNNRNKSGRVDGPGLHPRSAGAREVRDILEEMDAARDELQLLADDLWALQTRDKSVRRSIKAFLAEGGCTARDWARFIEGEQIRGDAAARRRHLRLVVANRRRRHLLAHHGPSAA